MYLMKISLAYFIMLFLKEREKARAKRARSLSPKCILKKYPKLRKAIICYT